MLLAYQGFERGVATFYDLPGIPEILDLDALETGGSESIPHPWEPRLLDWVDDLPPASRAVIVLHYLEEMSLDDVAAVLEISPGTVKSRLAYGLARLRRHTAGTQTNT